MRIPQTMLFLSVTSFFVATAVVPTPLQADQASEETSAAPNVLFIAVDDLNDWIGCLEGHPQAITPNMDRLAKRGVLFSNAHCQAPICNPSRVSLLTGLLPSTTGIYLLGPSKFRMAPVLKDHATLPEAFAAAGYRTIGCGKIYHAGTGKETFQKYGPRGGFGPRPDKKINYPIGHPLWDWGAFPERDEQMPDHQVTTWAIQQLRNHAKTASTRQPLFLAVGMHRPHVPMYVPQKWFDRYPPLDEIQLPKVLDSDRHDLPEYGKKLTYGGAAPRHQWMTKNDQWKKAVRAYLASITFADAQVGRLLDALADSPFADNTLVVLFSDHGFALGEKQRWAKRALWERETNVPLIFAGPGVASAEGGRMCREPVGLIDIYPTLVDLCGLGEAMEREQLLTVPLEGHSLRPLLTADDADWPHAAICTFHYQNHSVITTDHRYIRYHDGSEELYDTTADPHEWHNLAGKPGSAEVIDRLRNQLPNNDVDPVPNSAGLDCLPDDLPLFPGAVK